MDGRRCASALFGHEKRGKKKAEWARITNDGNYDVSLRPGIRAVCEPAAVAELDRLYKIWKSTANKSEEETRAAPEVRGFRKVGDRCVKD